MVLKLRAEIITILPFTRNRGSRKTMNLNLNQITLTTWRRTISHGQCLLRAFMQEGIIKSRHMF